LGIKTEGERRRWMMMMVAADDYSDGFPKLVKSAGGVSEFENIHPSS